MQISGASAAGASQPLKQQPPHDLSLITVSELAFCINHRPHCALWSAQQSCVCVCTHSLSSTHSARHICATYVVCKALWPRSHPHVDAPELIPSVSHAKSENATRREFNFLKVVLKASEVNVTAC
jgi:hypothetical protein